MTNGDEGAAGLIDVLGYEDTERWNVVVGETTLGLRDHLLNSGSLPDERTWGRVLDESQSILGMCCPIDEFVASRTGLVCGRVQSGKTMSMTTVSTLARDNHYRLVILIAGVTTNLVEQTRTRLQGDLRGAGRRWNWVILTNPSIQQDADQLAGLVREWRDDGIAEPQKRTLAIVVMKQHRHLRKLIDLLNNVDLRRIPAIVFDDEADQASMNIRPTAPVPSTIYQHISDLRGALPHHTFLQYTATPQAPLLISRIDLLSADFAEVVSPGPRYVGGDRFFRDRVDLVESIPPTDVFDHDNLPEVPPDSLLDALRVYFIGVAIGMLAGADGNRSMLIHPSHRRAVHDRYELWVNRLRADWFRALSQEGDPDRDELVAEFRSMFDRLFRGVEGTPAFEGLLRILPSALNQALVTKVNSLADSNIDWDNAYAHILVGGEKLGRGYTVNGLTVTYMPRPPGGWTADTIQQRARFFGYHERYLDLCRLYLHTDVRTAYTAYVRHEDELRKQLDRYSGRDLKDWKRVFYLDRRLRPTRRAVLETPYLRPEMRGGWFVTSRPHRAPDNGGTNWILFENLREHVPFEQDEEYPQHEVAFRVSLADVLENFLIPLAYPDEVDSVGLCAINCQIADVLEERPDEVCTIYVMNRGEARRRAMVQGRVQQLFQGRSSAGSQNYPGDRAFHNSHRFSFQLHNLTLTSDDEEIPNVLALALRPPKREDMIVHL